MPCVFTLNGEFITVPLAANVIPIGPNADKVLNVAVGYAAVFGETVGVVPAFAILKTKK